MKSYQMMMLAAAVAGTVMLSGCGESQVTYSQDSEIEIVTSSEPPAKEVSVVEDVGEPESEAEVAVESIPTVPAVVVTEPPKRDPFDTAETDIDLVKAAGSYLDEMANSVLDAGETTTHTLRDITLFGHPATVSVRYPDGAAGDSKPNYIKVLFTDDASMGTVCRAVNDLEGCSKTDEKSGNPDGNGDCYIAEYAIESANLEIESCQRKGGGEGIFLIISKLNPDAEAAPEATPTPEAETETADGTEQETAEAVDQTETAGDTGETAGTTDTGDGDTAGEEIDNTNIDIDALYADDDGGNRAE